jgi:hypothetical protein
MTTCSFTAMARPTFDIQAAQQFMDEARALLTDLKIDFVGFDKLVMTPDDALLAAHFIQPDAKFHILLNASFSDASAALDLLGGASAPVLLWSVREFGVSGERLLLNSMCGSNLAAHALRTVGKAIFHVHGNPSEASTKALFEAASRGIFPAIGQPELITGELASPEEVSVKLAKLRGKTIGAIGDAPAGFTPCNYDPDVLRETFGVEISQQSIEELFCDIAAVSLDLAEAEYQSACEAQPSLREVNQEQAKINAKTSVALKNLVSKNNLRAIAMRCWPDFAVDLGACPCGAMSRSADRGTPSACERDVMGALTMVLLEELGSGINYLVDTVDIDEEENLVRLWHCGSAATSLAVDPNNATQFTHCNRKLGVAGNFALKTGPVVLVRLDEDSTNPTKVRLFMTSGESISADNRFQGNTATVRVHGSARKLVNGLITNGFPHHTVLAWNDVRPQIRRVAQLLSIPLTEW